MDARELASSLRQGRSAWAEEHIDELIDALDRLVVAHGEIDGLKAQLREARREARLEFAHALVATQKEGAALAELREARASDERFVGEWLTALEPMIGDAAAFAPQAPVCTRVKYAIRKAVHDFKALYGSMNSIAWAKTEALDAKRLARRALTSTLAWRRTSRTIWTEYEPTK